MLREVAVWRIHRDRFLKIISSVAYLEEGILDPDDKVYNRGFFRNERLYPNYTLDDTAPPGDYDFVRAFKRSSNTYFIHYALTPDDRTDQWQQGKRILLDWGNRFRLGKKTIQPWAIAGDELPSPIREGEGYFPPRGNEFKKVDQFGKSSRWAAGDVANLCIGQGEIIVTPLQMAVMTSAVANGGKLMQPRLILRVEFTARAWPSAEPGYSKRGGGRPQSQAGDHLAIT